ncbi:MAG TPA: PqqD family protein [Gemmatimonadaceae bacterium]|nr:PqqD family protein [Gemmatimonadaceae bacterium]
MTEAPARYHRTDTVIPRKVAGELVLVPADVTSVYEANRRAELYILNGTGEHLWDLLALPCTVDHLADELVREYEVTDTAARADSRNFIDAMLAIGAVTQD